MKQLNSINGWFKVLNKSIIYKLQIYQRVEIKTEDAPREERAT